jgi:hypothetical protein
MTANAELSLIERLIPFIGTWTVEAHFQGQPASGTLVFEWGPGKAFVIQRWGAAPPGAPDALCVIGVDEARQAYRQHYFDSRGVARVYEMRFEDGEWGLIRTTADFTPLEFAQRFTARFSDDLSTIRGSWESSSDGTTWKHDFELIYTRAA